MSILTAPVNRIVRDEHLAKSHFEDAIGVLDNTCNFNQGDLICLLGGVMAPAVTESTDSAKFLGIARTSVVNGKILSPYQGTAVDGAQAIVAVAGPLYSCVASLLLSPSESITPGDEVY